jgi:hypothetical protein
MINRFFKLFLLFLVFPLFGIPQTINTTVATITSPPGIVSVPVSVTNFNNVGAISLVLQYNTASLTYLGYQNLNPGLASGMLIINATNGKVFTSWISSTPINIGNAVLYELKFQTTGSSGYLNWDTGTPGNCEYSNGSGAIIPAIFINGGVNLPPPNFQLSLKAFLEGPYTGKNMSNDLNISGYLPLSQPYNIEPWNYNGTENVNSIPNPNIVDWVLVELRETSGSASTATTNKRITRKAAFLLNNGSIVDLDGTSNLQFNLQISQNLYVVIWHRNHIAIMNANALILAGGMYSHDFTIGSTQTYGGMFAIKQLNPGVWGMFSGDGNADKSIGTLDKTRSWKVQAGQSGYKSGDFNMNGQVNNRDKCVYWQPNIGKSCQAPE